MKKSASVSVRMVSAVASLALTLGCGSSKPTHQKTCGDEAGRTVDWSKCEDEARKYEEGRRGGVAYLPLYHWYYGPFGARTPAIGEPLTGFSRTQPVGRGVRVANAPAVRGGFGSSAKPTGVGT